MAENEERNILLRRILVAVDTSGHSRAALEAAAALAKITEAHLHGLFIHEEQWSKISSLPSTQTINVLTGDRRSLYKDELEEQVRLLKHRLQQQLKSVSRRNDIDHSWESSRGHVEEEILKAARQADLITIGRRGRSFPQKQKLGSSAKAVIRQIEKPILILKEGLKLGNSITVVYDASEGSQRGLQLGLSLARKNNDELMVLVANNNEEVISERNKEVEKIIENATIPVKIQLLNKPDIWQLLNSVNDQRSGLLIVSKHQPLVQGSHLDTALTYIKCPVLMMS